ncbi:28S ribosomal protein S29, mitochondrial isoform X2 [Rhinatrema bivittatum]|uniref:28S ribosomal protein S29, mitochondrial isoform X2 n=1 Tax=Rhinatrema bivittatum TaxID=194408 RepID=UPI001128A790|nr:28S ribosomal protein S29, mitochondrial isoform X2 [Rhinatrema bivittatum]
MGFFSSFSLPAEETGCWLRGTEGLFPCLPLLVVPWVRGANRVCMQQNQHGHTSRASLAGMMVRSLKRLSPLYQKLDQGYLLPFGARAWMTDVAAVRTETISKTPRVIFQTSESDPTKTFNETCLMVRRPALEVIHYLRNTNFSHPAVRYVIYGRKGTGKSLTLCHVIHYCARQDWLLLHVPDAHILVKNCKELMQSSHKSDRYDQPLEASTWLKNFKVTNERFLKQIQTQQRYVWSKREVTEEGRPLGEVVDQGISRVKSASDVVGVVLKELKRQCALGAFRMLVAAEGVNSLWGRTTLKREDKSPIAPEELTLVHNLRKMMRNDWTGGAIVVTVSQTGSLFHPRSAYLPHELLGKEGFDALDPFVPVQVSNYSEREFESCYQYYLNRKWLQHERAHTEEGKKELLFLSNSNPRELERICAFL